MKIYKLLTVTLVSILWLLTTNKVFALTNIEVVTEINQIRNNTGKASLNINEKLNWAASLKLADITQYRYWAHNNPITQTQWTYFVRKTGYRGYIGENLASNYSSANQVINAWLNSPTHRNNLLNSGYREVGIAIGEVQFDTGTETVVVTEFGAGTRI